MKVYTVEDGEFRLIGRAEIDENKGPIFKVPLFGASSTIIERYVIKVVMKLQFSSHLEVDRGVVLRPGQRPELLPGWSPLTS